MAKATSKSIQKSPNNFDVKNTTISTSTQVDKQRSSKQTKTTKKPPRKTTKTTAKRDEKGRFVKGYQPPTTFRDRPDDRYDITKDDNFNPRHSPRYQLRKLWAMPKDDVKKKIMTAETATDITYGEYLELLQANRARRSSKDFETTMNQAEGAPLQPIDMEIAEEEKSPYDELTADEIRKLLGEIE